MVAGYAIGGGHVLHVVCDLTIAADNARFGQTGPRVGSFDGGFGASYLASIVGQKKAREIWFLCRQYDAQQALQMGLVNTVVPWPSCRRRPSAGARRCSSSARSRCGCSSRASTPTSTARPVSRSSRKRDAALLHVRGGPEGRNAYVERRKPDFKKFPRRP
jgi:naphthoate synthase